MGKVQKAAGVSAIEQPELLGEETQGGLDSVICLQTSLVGKTNLMQPVN